MVYIKELKHYSRKAMLEKLGDDEKVLDKLTKNNFIKVDDEDYSFDYVGIIIIDDLIINVYPKYVPSDELEDNIKTHFKQVIKVIKKDKLTNRNLLENEESDDVSFNMLSLMLFFIEDYYENGLYTHVEDTLETNGSGEINWDKTINNTFAIISDDNPYYIDLQTKGKINDLYDYFRLLHEYIITDCSKYLEKKELMELFALTPVELSDRTLNDFGEKTDILEKIRKELNVVFNTHKQKLLQSMYSYISGKNPFSEENYITTYGTGTFYQTWENMCCMVLNDKKNKRLEQLKLPVPLHKKYDGNKELIELIEKPVWKLGDEKYYSSKTLIPDLITISDDEFIIYDAKYYVYRTKNHLIESQPGIESVTKQYLYELAYKEFIQDHKFNKTINGFLFPKYGKTIENKGYVELNMLSNMNLQNIQIILLPVNEVYDCYLKNKKIKRGYGLYT